MTSLSHDPTGLSSQNPWPGLRAFTENDREFFFGRERETAELLTIVKRNAVVVLYGQSGLGKTSLLQAGLFPELKQLDFLPLRLRLDHSDEAAPLAEQIKLALTSELQRAEINAPPPDPHETLWEYFHRRDVDFWGPRNRLLTPVIVLDQFEEVFTLGQRNEAASARVAQFAADLESLIEHRPPEAVRERLEMQPEDALKYDFQRQSVKFVLSLREDFLAQLDPLRARMPSLLAHRFRLERMTGAQALAVVECAGHDLVGHEVAQDIVDFVSTSQRRRTSRSMEQRDVEPALLSVVCDELNRRRIDRGQPCITADLLTVEREGIIQSFYDRAFDGIDPRVRDWVEDELLTASGYRDRAAMEDALRLGLPEKDFDLLVDRRILHREEREGVVWLELTHDLLSDPAAQSRTSREAKAAAIREAEIAKKLSRTRRLAAVFAVLTLATLSAFIYMLVLRHQMQLETKSKLAALEQAQRATATAETSFQSLIKAVDGRAEMIREYLTGDMRIPSATVRKVINDADQDFQSLAKMVASNQIASSSDLELRHARFLTESGEALQQAGDFSKGGQKADSALKNLDSISELHPQEKNKDVLQITRAKALRVRGECRLATGDVTGAREDFEQSSRLASSKPDGELKHDAQRVFIRSQIGLGNSDVRAFAFAAAAGRFDQTLKYVKSHGTTGNEGPLWKVMALQGMAMSQTEDDQSERWFGEAAIALGDKAAQESNLRRKRVFAELAYQRGFIAYRLGKTDEAAKFFEEGDAASEELTNYDPDNLDWRLSQVQSWRGLGMVHLDRGEWDLAQEILERTEKAVKQLNDAEPAWVQARFLRGAVIYVLGELIQRKNWDLPPDSRDPNAQENTLKKYDEARSWLQQSTQAAPKNLALLASVIASQGGIYSDQASASGVSPQVKQEKNKKALELYTEARRTLQPIEATEKNAMANYYRWSGDASASLSHHEDAIAFYRKALSTRLGVVKKSPTPDHYFSLAGDYERLGGTEESKDASKAVAEYALATQNINLALSDRKGRPKDVGFLRLKADIYAATFDLRRKQGDLAGALNAMDTALATVWGALQDNYSNKNLNDDLGRYRNLLKQITEKLEVDPGLSKNASQSANLKAPAAPPQSSDALLRKTKDLLAKTDPGQLMERNQQRAWLLPPLVPGAWRTLGSNELQTACSELLAAKADLTREQILGIRKLPVDFYDNAALYEAEVTQKDGQRGIVSYLQRGKKTIVLDGWRDRISSINRETPPRLDSVERATAYLRFYVGALQYEDGRFMLVDQVEDLRWRPDVKAEMREEAAQKIKPLVVQPSQSAGWQGIGTVQLAQKLYYASFQLSRVGYVDIPGTESAVNNDLPIAVEGFLQGIRGPYTDEMGLQRLREQLAKNPNDESALRNLPGRYSKLHRWKEAAEAEQNWVNVSISKPKDAMEPKATMAKYYDSLSWYQLRAGEFNEGLSSADAGKKLDPSSILLEADRAHALMLVGRVREAGAIDTQLENNSIAQAAFTDRVTLCTQFGRWKEAAEGEQKVIAAIQREAKNDAKQLKKLPDAYQTLAWVQLRAGDFVGGLSSAEAGKKLDPSDIFLEADRAHALLLLGRVQEADAVYKQLETTSSGQDILRDRLTLCSDFKLWKLAVEGEQEVIALIQRKSPPEQRDKLPGEYTNLSWFQLMARDFSGALASSEAGLKLNESSLPLETNHAHALMFLGRTQEAEAVYLRYRGKKVYPNSDRTWEQVILQDLDDLEAEGLKDPEIARVRSLLKPGTS